MHVEIEHAEAGGGFFSGPRHFVVKLRATLSPEEYEIVQQKKLWKYIAIRYKNASWDSASERDRQIMNEWYERSVRDVCAGLNETFRTPLEAKNFAAEARKHIKALKDFIDANGTIGTKESFDL